MIHEDELFSSAHRRPWWFVPALGAVVLGGVIGALMPGADRSAMPTVTHPPTDSPFVPANYDVRLPADISGITGANCGFPSIQVPGARFEPARQMATGLWRFDGCVISAGSVYYDLTLVLSFPSGEQVTVPAVARTNRDGETRFSVEVNRATVNGAKATLYANYAPKP